jgi:hypothetical protein
MSTCVAARPTPARRTYAPCAAFLPLAAAAGTVYLMLDNRELDFYLSGVVSNSAQHC